MVTLANFWYESDRYFNGYQIPCLIALIVIIVLYIRWKKKQM